MELYTDNDDNYDQYSFVIPCLTLQAVLYGIIEAWIRRFFAYRDFRLLAGSKGKLERSIAPSYRGWAFGAEAKLVVRMQLQKYACMCTIPE